MFSLQSFAAIAKASSEQLQNLPGFGQVKAKRIQDAFNKPFRNNSTSALPVSTQLQLRASQQSTTSQGVDKGKQREGEPLRQATSSGSTDEDGLQPVQFTVPSAPRPPPAPRPRVPREPSPAWDIELDLNDSPEQTPETGPPPVSGTSATSRKRPPSPVWDIELDLNASETEDDDNEGEDGRSRKRPREGSGEFGAPTMLTGT